MEGGRPPGLLHSLRALADSALLAAQVRLGLLGTELEEQKLRLAHGLAWAFAGVLLLVVALVLLAGLVVMLVREQHRLLALALLVAGFGGAGAWVLLRGLARLRSPGPMFAASLDELARDRAALAPRESP